MFLDISTTAWQVTYMLIALLIPVILGTWVLRVFVGAGKKTIKAIKR